MRSRRQQADSQAVARRLELLSRELAGMRPAGGPGDEEVAESVGDAAGEARAGRPVLHAPDSGEARPRHSVVHAPETHTRIRQPRPAEPEPGSSPRTARIAGPAPRSEPLFASPERALPETTVPRAVPGPQPESLPGAQSGPLPVPGRHAARQRTALADLVPATLRGRVALGPAQLAVIAVAVAIGMVITAWWVVRGDAEGRPLAVPGQPASGLLDLPDESAQPSGPDLAATTESAATGEAGAEQPGAATDPAAESAELVVDVAGKVRRPGIAVLPAGSRVVDAIEAAGGARKGVDLTDLNLARPLVDGEQVLVGVEGGAVAGPASGPAAAPEASAAGGLVNLNSADQATLETLPGVGPVTAAAILDWRAQHGAFSSVEELVEVNGIGEATLARLLPHVTL